MDPLFRLKLGGFRKTHSSTSFWLTAKPSKSQATNTNQSTDGLHRGFSPSTVLQTPSPATNLRRQLDQLAVIDGRTVITGSFNWSPSAAHQNDETLLVIESAPLAKHFTAEINRLWKGAELGITARLERKQAKQRKLCGQGT